MRTARPAAGIALRAAGRAARRHRARPADEADVARGAWRASDVRCAAANAACPGGAGSDFAGRVLMHTTVRITDRDNGVPDEVAAGHRD